MAETVIAERAAGITGKDDQPHLTNVVESFTKELDADYSPPHIKRHAHPKMHGCVQAIFRVERDVPEDLRHGVFAARGKEFKAWVRFSNAIGVDHDMKFGNRGMAIKLLEVDGTRLLENEKPFSEEKRTQDFVLSTYAAFVLPRTTEPYHYEEFSAALRKGVVSLIRLMIKLRLWRGLVALARGGIFPARNPLTIRYFSQTAYKLGPSTVKLHARPVMTRMLARQLPNRPWFFVKMVTVNIILNLSSFMVGRWLLRLFGFQDRRPAADEFCDHYIASRHLLRYALAASLSAEHAEFEIGVQTQTTEGEMPSDNPTKVWSERKSPFRRVATLLIPRQVFWPASGMPPKILGETSRMMEVGENLSFNPWHGLIAHEPLGDINRARGKIYDQISKFRHKENDAERPDPLAEYNRLFDVVQLGRMEP